MSHRIKERWILFLWSWSRMGSIDSLYTGETRACSLSSMSVWLILSLACYTLFAFLATYRKSREASFWILALELIATLPITGWFSPPMPQSTAAWLQYTFLFSWSYLWLLNHNSRVILFIITYSSELSL